MRGDTPTHAHFSCTACDGVRVLVQDKCYYMNIAWPPAIADLLVNK